MSRGLNISVNPNRLREDVGPVLIIVAGIAAVAFGAMLATNLLFPGLSAQSGLSLSAIGDSLTAQVTAVSDLTGLTLGTDLILFVAGYILVCISLWLQAELRTYITNRGHF